MEDQVPPAGLGCSLGARRICPQSFTEFNMKAIHSRREVRGQGDEVCGALLDATLRCGHLALTYVCTAAESDDQQQQWPEAAHRRRGGEALSPAATASGSPHPCPCRARRGEWTDLQRARTGGVQAFSLLLLLVLLLLPLLPHSSLLPLVLGCAGALKHSCSAECRAEEGVERQKEEENKV